MRVTIGAFVALSLALAQGATAQPPGPRSIAVPATADWQHAGSQMILPPRVGGLVRLRIGDNSQDGQDVNATYVDREEGMIALVYLYRTGAGDLPLWFDRAVATIMLPQAGAAPPAIAGFTRPGASVASGLRAAMSDSVAGMRSTAVAIAPLGSSWLVKVRLGSARLDPAALSERLSAFAAALRWPPETGSGSVAVPIEPCPTPLRLRTARVLRPDATDMLMDSVIGTVEPEGEAGPPSVYCREPGATVEWGVYRPGRATDSYLIAVNDAGIAVAVSDASALSALLGQSGRRRFSVTLFVGNGSSVYSSFDRLPPPDQVLALVRGGQPLATTTDGRENR